MSVHTSPDLHQENLRPWSLVTSSVRLRSDEPLAAFKTCNRLPQIIARGEAEEARADEALLANSEGWVVEGAASNLFWIQNGIVHTPPLESGILPGITRAVLLELCQQLRMETRQTNLTGEQLRETEGVFLSLSSIGIAEAVSLDGKALRQSAITQRLHAAYVQRLRQQSAKV
jgi:branched-subunit amino acid aminotransferase/4-amino-4-deoxychorismate lyase